ncbi:MAG: hypothetical protein NC399_05125 [Muribaculum sp.]|nr:hypothetical protein [Muribaculum sp.]
MGTPFLIAIDGRCAAGKTTLAAHLEKQLDCAVFHMDDFFLQPGQRTPERLSTPGGNVDYERFRSEILIPLKDGAAEMLYRVYNCKTQTLSDPVRIRTKPVCIVEGSYSCHPALWEYYDLHVFLTVEREEQMRRIRERGGAEAVKSFSEKWIPLEETYFAACGVEQKCELQLRGD